MQKMNFEYETLFDGSVKISKHTVGNTETSVPSEINGRPVKAIGYIAFADRHDLQGIIIPESLRSIGIGAFGGCTSLTNIAIPKTAGTIGKYTFGWKYDTVKKNHIKQCDFNIF